MTYVTLTEHNIFKKVFLNSSPPDFQTLYKVNIVLSTIISCRVLNTPTKQYINKLTDKTEHPNTRNRGWKGVALTRLKVEAGCAHLNKYPYIVMYM
jgi:hypothetical protein